MKKVELHVHFDGSFNPVYLEKLAGRDVSAEVSGRGATSLAEYLRRFELPIVFSQTKEQLEQHARLLAQTLVLDDVIYAEIRFCPLFHAESGLSPDEVIDSVLKGLHAVPAVKTSLILCMMRQFDYEQNLSIIELAGRWKDRGVCGIDLAGDEATYPNFAKPAFSALLRNANHVLPTTVHAGESAFYEGADASYRDIDLVLDDLVRTNHAKRQVRIGHGIHAIDSMDTVAKLIQYDIPLEICLSSNIDTGAYPSLEAHPVRRLLDLGVKITISTDNRTVTSTTLEREYQLLRKIHGFTDAELLRCNLNAAATAFADSSTKAWTVQQLLEDYTASHPPKN